MQDAREKEERAPDIVNPPPDSHLQPHQASSTDNADYRYTANLVRRSCATNNCVSKYKPFIRLSVAERLKSENLNNGNLQKLVDVALAVPVIDGIAILLVAGVPECAKTTNITKMMAQHPEKIAFMAASNESDHAARILHTELVNIHSASNISTFFYAQIGITVTLIKFSLRPYPIQ